MEHLPILLAWCRRQKKLEGLGHRVSHSIKQICTLKKVRNDTSQILLTLVYIILNLLIFLYN